MFTEGLDPNSVKWVSERGIPISNFNNRIRIDPVSNIGSGGRGFGLPSPAKFSSGHLPSRIINVPLTVPSNGGDRESGSDMDTESDSDEENYIGRYSIDSSPEDDLARRIPSCSSQVGSNNISVPQGGTHSEGYRTSVHSRASYEKFTERDFQVKRPPDKVSDDKVPSAPSICDLKEVNRGPKQDQASSSPLVADSDCFSIRQEQPTPTNMMSGVASQVSAGSRFSGQSVRSITGVEAASSASSLGLPSRLPSFHASALGPWGAVISYDACVRLCLHSWAKGCMEAPVFLENECALLRSAFGLNQVLLQSEEELLATRSSNFISEGPAPKPKKTIGKLKVQVRKVRMAMDRPTGCSLSSFHSPMVNWECLRGRLSNLQSTLSSGWQTLRSVRMQPQLPANGSFSGRSLAYMHASSHYIKQVSGLLKNGVTTLRTRSSSYEAVQERYACFLRLKSSNEGDAVRMRPGSGETHIFFPDSLGDDLIIEVQDSKGKYCGRVLAQVATVVDERGDKVRWWSIYHEPQHELIGRMQLCINYSTSVDENGHLKCGSVAETVAYDFLLEVAMKVQHFQPRNLLLHGQWNWLLSEFAAYYGVSDAYAKLRYLSYVMDVATPTADCLVLVHNLLLPVIMKGSAKNTLSHQENRILGEVEDRTEQILSLVFENYKSLDESSPSGIHDVFRVATGSPAPALAAAVKLYTLLHDVFSPEAQLKLCSYFQAAARKRLRRHLSETDEFITSNNEVALMDAEALSTAYQKMRSLCLNIRNEIFTDIEIHNQNVLLSCIELQDISSSIYSVELCTRLRAFLVACPPTSPSPPVTDLVIAAADFQRDLVNWNIKPVKGGLDAKELFHLYVMVWIQDKRLCLLESCKLDKVKWSGVRTQHSTTPFVDDMYDRLKETLNEYEIIICRWPEYTFVLEDAIAEVEKALVEALDKQYADVLSPLKDSLMSKKFGLNKYVHKFAKGSVCTYTVPEDLGILLNSMKRMLDLLRPRIDTQLKSWGSCILNRANAVPGERLSEITVMLRSKFRNYLQAIVEKLVENTKVQSATRLKKIIQDSKETVTESDVRSRMQSLKDLLTKSIDHLRTIFDTHVFVALCRGYWDRMGQDVLSFLDQRKENRSWYKGSRVAVSVLDDTFASQMQQLLGNALQEKDLEPPRSIMEVRSMLCKDAMNQKDSNYYY